MSRNAALRAVVNNINDLTQKDTGMKTITLRMLLGLGLLAAMGGPAAIPDPSGTNLWWAQGIGVPVNEQAKTFLPKDRQANFTFHDGVADWQAGNAALAFTLTTNRALLGWGN